VPFAELWARGGEPAFREIERAAVADVCASPVPLVIACGGGTVIDPDNRRRLRDAGFVVWLDAPVDVLERRVGDGATRPLLKGNPRDSLARLLAIRETAYDAAAHARVDTADRTVDDVATTVLDAFCGVTQ